MTRGSRAAARLADALLGRWWGSAADARAVDGRVGGAAAGAYLAVLVVRRRWPRGECSCARWGGGEGSNGLLASGVRGGGDWSRVDVTATAATAAAGAATTATAGGVGGGGGRKGPSAGGGDAPAGAPGRRAAARRRQRESAGRARAKQSGRVEGVSQETERQRRTGPCIHTHKTSGRHPRQEWTRENKRGGRPRKNGGGGTRQRRFITRSCSRACPPASSCPQSCGRPS